MSQQNNHRPPKTGPVAPTPTSFRPGASPPDTPSPDAPSPVTPSNANPVARIRNSTMMSPRGSSSSMSSDYLEQQADGKDFESVKKKLILQNFRTTKHQHL